MYFLYLDDSGSPGNSSESHFVFGGLCIHEDSIYWLSKQLDLLAETIEPTNPQSLEFHAAECFRGVQEPWKSMTKDRRRDVIKNVLFSMKEAWPDSIMAFGCAVHKDSFPGQDPVIKAFEDISSRFSYFVEHHQSKDIKQHGVIIIDKSSYELGLQTLVKDFRQNGNRWGGQLRNICEVPLFVDSRASRLIQLADHIAYAIHRRYNQNDLTYFNCFENRFEEYDGKIQSLAHLQHYNKSCTCPSCISRK
jgi:hypothetical protein